MVSSQTRFSALFTTDVYTASPRGGNTMQISCFYQATQDEILICLPGWSAREERAGAHRLSGVNGRLIVTTPKWLLQLKSHLQIKILRNIFTKPGFLSNSIHKIRHCNWKVWWLVYQQNIYANVCATEWEVQTRGISKHVDVQNLVRYHCVSMSSSLLCSMWCNHVSPFLISFE